jgi:Flp pilus assembly protein TadD/spermidine synthase
MMIGRVSSAGEGIALTESAARPSNVPSWAPQATVFVSSFCVMVIELVAGRMVSRHLGASLYTWTSVIGVVLAGLAAGNYLGGRLADRRAPLPTLSTLFVLASVASAGIGALEHQVGGWAFLWTLPWAARVATHVALVFVVPSLLLGMIGPVAAKMALDRGRETGRTIGGVYAWGVIGSLAGTFATGFWLIAAFGTSGVIWSVAGVLGGTGLLFATRSALARTWGSSLLPLAVLGTGPWPWAEALGARLSLRDAPDPDLIYSDESQYSHIRVFRVSESPDVRNLHLDKLLHSSVVMGRPERLQYGYERIYAAATAELAGPRDSLATLTIGGGGYVFPRWIDDRWPASRTDVVEIDPAVTRAAIAALGLPEDHGFGVVHGDGRAHVRRMAEAKRRGGRVPTYDCIYLDVFDDYSVPYQLTTVEFARDASELLAPDGAFLMNLIDDYASGRFLACMVLTLESIFPHVEVLAEGRPVSSQPGVRNTWVLVATRAPLDVTRLVTGYDRRIGLQRLTATERDVLTARHGVRPLTDDWAPVENLLAPVVRRASPEMAARLLAERAQRSAGPVSEALRDAERAVRLRPDSEEAHRALAGIRLRAGDVAGAVAVQREVVRLAPGSSRDWHRLGVLLVEEHRFEEAIDAYRRAVELAPEDLEALNDLGIALARAGRLEEGIACFEQILRADPSHAKAGPNLESARQLLARRSARP